MTARMQTDLLATSAATQTGKAVGIAVELLRKGNVVALPTETVYGLAASALNAIAVTKIFETKERPRFDPLIVHLPNREWLGKIAKLPADQFQPILSVSIDRSDRHLVFNVKSPCESFSALKGE